MPPENLNAPSALWHAMLEEILGLHNRLERLFAQEGPKKDSRWDGKVAAFGGDCLIIV